MLIVVLYPWVVALRNLGGTLFGCLWSNQMSGGFLGFQQLLVNSCDTTLKLGLNVVFPLDADLTWILGERDNDRYG